MAPLFLYPPPVIIRANCLFPNFTFKIGILATFAVPLESTLRCGCGRGCLWLAHHQARDYFQWSPWRCDVLPGPTF